MRKRLLIGLLSAGLLAVMLPGVSGAGRDMVYVCHFPGHVNSEHATQPSRNAAANGHGDNFPGP